MIRGMKKQTELTAKELVGRPTYKEEFENVRHNVHKVILNSNNINMSNESDGQESHAGKSARSKMS